LRNNDKFIVKLRNVMIEKYFTILLPQLGLTPCKETTARNAICAYINENNI